MEGDDCGASHHMYSCGLIIDLDKALPSRSGFSVISVLQISQKQWHDPHQPTTDIRCEEAMKILSMASSLTPSHINPRYSPSPTIKDPTEKSSNALGMQCNCCYNRHFHGFVMEGERSLAEAEASQNAQLHLMGPAVSARHALHVQPHHPQTAKTPDSLT